MGYVKVLLVILFCSFISLEASADNSPKEKQNKALFVLYAKDAQIKDGELILSRYDNKAMWFGKSPYMESGDIGISKLNNNWNKYFDSAPNGAIRYEDGRSDALVLKSSRTVKNKLVFEVSSLTGKLRDGDYKDVYLYIDDAYLLNGSGKYTIGGGYTHSAIYGRMKLTLYNESDFKLTVANFSTYGKGVIEYSGDYGDINSSFTLEPGENKTITLKAIPKYIFNGSEDNPDDCVQGCYLKSNNIGVTFNYSIGNHVFKDMSVILGTYNPQKWNYKDSCGFFEECKSVNYEVMNFGILTTGSNIVISSSELDSPFDNASTYSYPNTLLVNHNSNLSPHGHSQPPSSGQAISGYIYVKKSDSMAVNNLSSKKEFSIATAPDNGIEVGENLLPSSKGISGYFIGNTPKEYAFSIKDASNNKEYAVNISNIGGSGDPVCTIGEDFYCSALYLDNELDVLIGDYPFYNGAFVVKNNTYINNKVAVENSSLLSGYNKKTLNNLVSIYYPKENYTFSLGGIGLKNETSNNLLSLNSIESSLSVDADKNDYYIGIDKTRKISKINVISPHPKLIVSAPLGEINLGDIKSRGSNIELQDYNEYNKGPSYALRAYKIDRSNISSLNLSIDKENAIKLELMEPDGSTCFGRECYITKRNIFGLSDGNQVTKDYVAVISSNSNILKVYPNITHILAGTVLHDFDVSGENVEIPLSSCTNGSKGRNIMSLEGLNGEGYGGVSYLYMMTISGCGSKRTTVSPSAVRNYLIKNPNNYTKDTTGYTLVM